MRYLLFILLFSFCTNIGQAQKSTQDIPLISLQMPDSLHKKRVWICGGASTAVYSGISVVLWNSWYKDFETGKFRFFDDRGEWEGMDKAGHFFTAYNQARWSYNGLRWMGVKEKNAVWVGSTIAFGLQMTVEVMDGFSEKWGFSTADIAYNTGGVILFVGQQYLWKEQRIIMKVSSNRVNYSTEPIFDIDGGFSTTLQDRADALYGTSFVQRFLKDYNAQTIWASANIHSFLPNREQSKFPKWLNVAVGFGAENMFSGFGTQFNGEEGGTFAVDPVLFPRHNQAFLSLDIDLTRIPTKSRLLQSIFSVVNFIKIPAPTLEYSRVNGFQFHALR